MKNPANQKFSWNTSQAYIPFLLQPMKALEWQNDPFCNQSEILTTLTEEKR